MTSDFKQRLEFESVNLSIEAHDPRVRIMLGCDFMSCIPWANRETTGGNECLVMGHRPVSKY